MRKVPKLRFKEFSDKWEEKRLGDIFERITEKNTENNTNVLTISAQYGLISQTEFFNKSVAGKDLSKYYLLKKDDFAYNKSYSNGYPFGAIKKLNKYEKGIVSTLYICFRLKNRSNIVDFFEQFFESKKIDKNIQDIAQEGARNHGLLNINVQDFFDITKYTPSIQEQEKIANFLTNIDKKISLTEEKLELFREYKKGVMQKIFSQELRFKDSNGNDYPEWEEKKIEDVFKITRGYVLSKNEMKEIKDKDFIYPVFSSQTLNNGLMGFYNKYLYENTITWTTDGANAGTVKFRSGKFYCTNVCGVLISDIYSNKCIAEILALEAPKHVSYVGNPKLMNNIMSKIKITIPVSLEEQQKIADFLSSIDSKIESIEKELEGLKEFKRGLLQQMFV